MTTILPATPAVAALRPVAFDLYRDIHKGIRHELFGLTLQAGNSDPADRCARVAVAGRLRGAVKLLVDHAHHEDGAIQPVLERELPGLAERIEVDHEVLEGRLVLLQEWADTTVDAEVAGQRFGMHEVYLELASFTSAYLAHQDMEERIVMPALADVLDFEALLGIHMQIISNIPPQTMAECLAVMLPAMNIDDRTELLGGMQASAPPEVFAGVWGLAGSVLTPADHKAVGVRLGVN